MMIKKIAIGFGIFLIALLIIGLIALQIMTSADTPNTKEELLEEISALLPELIIAFDQANLDDPKTCEEELEQIGYNLTLDIAGSFDHIRKIPFQHLWDESAKQLEELKKQARSTGFSFSFAAAYSCEGKGFFKLDKKDLRQSLLELEESIKELN